MGFMGFGMQKWIYTMRPRQPYSMERKGSFTKIPIYEREFKLRPSKNKGNYNFGILLFLVLTMLTCISIPNWLKQARIHNQKVETLREAKNDRAFKFLLTSGTRRLNAQNYIGALSEFKLAKNIKPNSIEANQLLLEVVSLLCEKNDIYCKEYENLQF
ncbi:hypothetical protein [uncultured Winogradskyella sp.]|uniref:hypothetical protein n=1 Tax=uncultured Winogradskyella sp. TaxID=395353 RepID=UPI0026309765|nr:hypothetical protein [uncultured Winogradskyella sp.]